MMKNNFYFMFPALFILTCLTFCPNFFDFVGKGVFLINPSSYMTKKSRQIFKYLENKKALFIIFKGFQSSEVVSDPRVDL